MPIKYYEYHDITHTANCGPPSPPINGYILPYASTLEGALVTIACFSDFVNGNQTINCTHHGIWEPNSIILCGTGPGSGSGN